MTYTLAIKTSGFHNVTNFQIPCRESLGQINLLTIKWLFHQQDRNIALLWLCAVSQRIPLRFSSLWQTKNAKNKNEPISKRGLFPLLHEIEIFSKSTRISVSSSRGIIPRSKMDLFTFSYLTVTKNVRVGLGTNGKNPYTFHIKTCFQEMPGKTHQDVWYLNIWLINFKWNMFRCKIIGFAWSQAISAVYGGGLWFKNLNANINVSIGKLYFLCVARVKRGASYL